MILGATPEFRDMLAKYPVNVILLDVNLEMKKAMDSLLARKPKKEKFIKANWLKMPFSDNYFDIVMGDTPHHNIKGKTYRKFFSQIRRVLKLDGYFLLSSWFFNKSQKNLTIREFINLYKKNPKFFHNFKNRTYALGMLGKNFYNKKTWEWNWQEVDEVIIKEAKKRGLLKEDLKYLLFDYGNYTQVAPWEPDFSKFLNRFFKIEKTWQDKSHIAMSFKKDWVMRKK